MLQVCREIYIKTVVTHNNAKQTGILHIVQIMTEFVNIIFDKFQKYPIIYKYIPCIFKITRIQALIYYPSTYAERYEFVWNMCLRKRYATNVLHWINDAIFTKPQFSNQHAILFACSTSNYRFCSLSHKRRKHNHHRDTRFVHKTRQFYIVHVSINIYTYTIQIVRQQIAQKLHVSLVCIALLRVTTIQVQYLCYFKHTHTHTIRASYCAT